MGVNTKFMILVIEYQGENEQNVETLVNKLEIPINSKYGQMQRVYQGDQADIVSALKKILELTG